MMNTFGGRHGTGYAEQDELCNFDPNRMYASVDIPQGTLNPSADDHTNNFLCTGKIETMAEAAIAEYGTPQEHSLPPSVPSPDRASNSTNCSGSTMDEGGDMEDCDSHSIATSVVTLVNGKQYQEIVPENMVLCINAGGISLSGTSFGVEFSGDSHFTGGDVLRTGENIADTKDPSVYQTARYGDFSYTIEDLPPGRYLVDLHFAEIIFTNGPPGMRMFDVYVQEQKVAAKLDIYSRVGSNAPLVLMNVPATIQDKGLSISFKGIVGSPTINAICIRNALAPGLVQPMSISNKDKYMESSNNMIGVQRESSAEVPYSMPELESLAKRHTPSNETRREKIKTKTKACVREYEIKIQELKNEVHQAWLSVQDANRQNEKLQTELDCKSFHVDSLAQAVEVQLNELKDVKDTAESEKQRWITVMHTAASQLQLIKHDYAILSKEAHEWVNSFPAIQTMTDKVQALVDEHEELKRKFAKQGQDLRLYYNQVLELKGNIRVFCRCRPLSTAEINSGAGSVVEFDATRDNELIVRSNGSRKVFKFDRVFSPTNNQGDVFADTAPVVVSVLDGYNVCIFAYGQTGTGKTFTMEGTEYDRGVNYRTLEELFQLASKRSGQFQYDISVSVLEVYNEHIRDLLAAPLPAGQNAKKLEIKQVAEGVHHVPGLTEARVQCMEEVWEVLQTGSSARAVGSTNSNERSSRSHCMLCVMVKGENLLTGECTRSKLWLVDLAGSERVAKTDVQGDRLKEAQNINKSLSALGDVIYALTTKSSHIPYRNSKLTHLLQDSLGGEAKTLMFVQISPVEQDVGETLCSLNFASRVRGVELGPARKQLDSMELVKYKQMIEKSKQDGRIKDDGLRKLEEALKMKEQTCRALSDKVRDNEGLTTIEKKARSIAESKLKEQQLLNEKQQMLIEKLKEDLKTKETSQQLALQSAGLRRQLDAVPVALALKKPLSEKIPLDNRLDTVEETKNTEPPDEHPSHEDVTHDNSSVTRSNSPGRLKVVPSRYNSSSPPSSRVLPRKPGRVSIAGVPRRRPSMGMNMVSVLPLITAPSCNKAEGVESVKSSCESLQDSFGDENVPALQPSAAPVVLGSATPSGWRKGSSITPSTVVRRSIPRKIHFKSPHLQPNYIKATNTAVDRDGARLPAADRLMDLQQQKKRDQTAQGEKLGAKNKMRRVSIATTWGKPPAPLSSQQQQPCNPAILPTINTGGAQRVLASSNNTTNRAANLYGRWNR